MPYYNFTYIQEVMWVDLFDSLCSGFVEPKNIEDYISQRDQFKEKGKGRDFRTAIYCIEEFIRDPNVSLHVFIFRLIKYEQCLKSNFHVLQRNLTKSQPDADRTVRVKREDDDDNDNTSSENEDEALLPHNFSSSWRPLVKPIIRFICKIKRIKKIHWTSRMISKI